LGQPHPSLLLHPSLRHRSCPIAHPIIIKSGQFHPLALHP
jgi:hypothetical protein